MMGRRQMMRTLAQADPEPPKDTLQVVRRLVDALAPYKKYTAGAFLLILVNAASQGLGPMLIGKAVDDIVSRGDMGRLAGVVAALAVVYTAGMFSMRYQMYFMGVAGQRVLADLRRGVFERIESLHLQYLEGRQAGDLMSRLMNDISVLNNFFSQAIAQMIGATFALLGIMAGMFFVDWRLALATLTVVPVMLIVTHLFSRWSRAAFRKTRTTIGDVSANMEEELGGVKVAQAFNRTRLNIRRFAARNAANRDANISAMAVTSAFGPAMDVLSTLDTALVAAYGGFLAIAGTISVGTVVAFLQYVRNFFRPIQTVARMWTAAQSAFAAAERVFNLLDREPELEDGPEWMPRIEGRVRFENVSFAYDGSKRVLENIDVSVEPGQTVAIVGPTGAGKSTMISLLARFYDVTEGSVRIDGHDVREVVQQSMRSQFGIVTQEPFLFSGTVLENIRYGRLESDDDEVMAAAEAANAGDFISRLPNGYQTEVGERGGMLSQGQKQLIAIARAVLADPRILILDEATASIDTRTEKLIQNALDRLLEGRTSFVIAHRLSTVRNADEVLVLDRGRIVERGTHGSLMESDGMYADLYKRQFYIPPDEREKTSAD